MDEAGVEGNIDMISDEEIICIKQISKLRKYSEDRDLDKEEVQIFDLLHKNLKIARGEEIRIKTKSKTKKLSNSELTNILKGK